MLKPALILGSGFHRYVFGETDHHARKTLFDWHTLVDAVALGLKVAVPSKALSPVQRWETLITRASAEGYTTPTSHVVKSGEHQPCLIEKNARRIVVATLAQAATDYPVSSRTRLPLRDSWGAVISLNFDDAWLMNAGNPAAKRPSAHQLTRQVVAFSGKELHRLTLNKLMVGVDSGAYRRLWFPNGACFAPETIRMGLHDYGAAAFAIKAAFSRLKQWENNYGISGKHQEGQRVQVCAALRYASEGAPTLDPFIEDSMMPLSWVADFLYRPLVFAGVGLSDQESGMWWLLAQRARNFSRKQITNRVYVLVKADDRPNFWNSRPFGITPVVCSCWDEGWAEIVDLVDGAEW